MGNIRCSIIRKFLALVLFLSCAAPAWPQQAPDSTTKLPSEVNSSNAPAESPKPSSQDDADVRLLQRITQLEAEVAELKQKQEASPPTPRDESVPPPVPSSEPEAPRLKLHVFGDVGARATDRSKTVSNTFDIGSLDLFMTSRISATTSLLGEVLFLSTSTNNIDPDIERLILQYHPNRYLDIGIGRYHTAIGYYNTAFHRGEWFQTPIGRPFIYQFDDTGGPLPLQEVGITTNGIIPSGKLRLHYIFEVGNGRSHLIGREPAQNNTDVSNGKSLNFGMYAQPSALPGLQTGFSIYHNYLIFSDNDNHGELISTAYIVFTNSTYELLNEAMTVRHSRNNTGGPGVFQTPAFYTQFSRRFSSFRPYFRYEYINAGVNEPIYGDPNDGTVVGRRNGPSVGVRWDFNEHAAAKLQYGRMYIRGVGSANDLATQFAFNF